MIEVLEEQIERGDALRQAALDARPFLVGEDARQQVVGENSLGAFLASVDGEGDALMQKGQIGDLLAAAQLRGRKLANGVEKMLVMRADAARSVDHFIERVIETIFLKWLRQRVLACDSHHGCVFALLPLQTRKGSIGRSV